MNDKEALEVVKVMLNTLRGRKGFSSWWMDIDEDTENEIINELMNEVKKQHNGV